VFALEALLSGDTREAIAEKVAGSAALLIGRGDDEAVAVRTLVKKAYACRSKHVHGGEVRNLLTWVSYGWCVSEFSVLR
jgi:hypothetical protein